jgi:hypothetical protein
VVRRVENEEGAFRRALVSIPRLASKRQSVLSHISLFEIQARATSRAHLSKQQSI